MHIFHTLSGAPLVKRHKDEDSGSKRFIEKANLLTELKSRRMSLPYEFLITGNRSLSAFMSSIGWNNLMRADSEASPIVGISKYNILPNLEFQSAI